MKKIIIIILVLVGVYFLAWSPTILSAYKDKIETEKREKLALEIMDTINNPYISEQERDEKLKELYNIPDSGVINKGYLQYEFSDNPYSDNSSKVPYFSYDGLYPNIRDIFDENDFEITYSGSDSIIANHVDDDWHAEITYHQDGNILETVVFICSDNNGEFNSKDYKFLKDLTNIFYISDFSIQDLTVTDDSSLEMENDWILDYTRIPWDDIKDNNKENSTIQNHDNCHSVEIYLIFKKELN